MARDGNGDYSRVEGPYQNGEIADADEVNAEFDDVAQALSDSINFAGTKDFAADQSMGGFRLTNLGAPTQSGDAVRKSYADATYQPLDADLTAIAALGYTSGTYIISKTAADTWALNSISANGLSLVAGADYAAMRTLLSLGTAALKNTGTSGDAVGLLNAANTWSAAQTFSQGAAATTPSGTFVNTTDAAAVMVQRLEGDRATPANGDSIYQSWYMSDGAGNQDEMARVAIEITDITSGSEDAVFIWSVAVNGTRTNKLQCSGGALYPSANDGLALGTTTRGWADLNVATGFTLNAANGNAVITHSSGVFEVTTGDLRVTTAGTDSASVVTVGGTQTLTNKTLTSPSISNPTITGDLKRPAPASGIDTTSSGYLGFGAVQSKTADFTFALADNGRLVQQNSASSEVATIPTNASVAFPIGNTAIPVENIGAGTMVLTPDTGVTLYDETGASGSITLSQHDGGVLYKTDTNTWRYRGSHD